MLSSPFQQEISELENLDGLQNLIEISVVNNPVIIVQFCLNCLDTIHASKH